MKISPMLLAFCIVWLAQTTVAAAPEESTQEQPGEAIMQSLAEENPNLRLDKPNHRFFNLHLGFGGAGGLGDELDAEDLGGIGGQFTIGLDFELWPPFALSILAGYNFFVNGGSNDLEEAFVALGVTGRFLVDRSGSYAEGGSVAGNLWFDAYMGYFNADEVGGSSNRGGYILGAGYEFALAEDINLGPYFRFQQTPIGDGLNYFLISGGVQVSLAGQFAPEDLDEDGVEDPKDQCIDQPEDLDGFDDLDGCPDSDNDRDGILDADDECPDVAETVNGQDDADGCPEEDEDLDGVLDAQDKCPAEPEDADDFEDADGCPDLDNDQDGLADDGDQCPLQAEDKDGFEDEDGCPDADNDGDGIADTGDQCPNEKETVNGVDDADGCPEKDPAS